MESNPFNRRIKSGVIPALPTCSRMRSQPFVEQKNKFSDTNQGNKKMKLKVSKGFKSETCPRPSKLQTDIKDLLHQAMKIRKSSRSVPGCNATSKDANISP
mmetsp:Transcript_6668/g.6228  ORF Transcript_6668/g.6228 Transcript_6668/m.6228 type:complete len:101 (+) Transcript_6668:98-400(+)